ncbi:hydroxylysine kinase-like [Lineus longissimus]|uniref:hydroxylysine kinase-like n=1 Tax=Lineus longissimus TaxID=88925 RepID=UPI002B4C3DE7
MADAMSIPSQPQVKEGTATKILKDVFGMSVKSIKQLDSYSDCNFLVKVEEQHSNTLVDTIWPHGYLLKFTNKEESLEQTYIETQCQVLLYLKKNGIDAPQSVKNLNGTNIYLVNIHHENGSLVPDEELASVPHGSYCVRLFTFLPENQMASLTNISSATFFEAGKFVAQVDALLQKSKLTNEDYENHTGTFVLDNLDNFFEKSKSIKDSAFRERLQSFLRHFEGVTIPALIAGAKRQPIHGDFNPHNILVKISDNGETIISGLIDIYDTSIGYVVHEIAICMTHLMYQFQNSHDIFEIGGHVLAGFLSTLKLSEIELNVIRDCILARLYKTVVIGFWTMGGEGADNEYVRKHTEDALQILDRVEEKSEKDLYTIWDSVRKSYV